MSTKASPLVFWVLYGPVLWLLYCLTIVKSIVQPFIRIVTSTRGPLVVRTPEECFEGLDKLGYNFKENYVQLAEDLPRIHYVDEGDGSSGRTILCLHGEPSWSFLYRKMIPPLVQAGHRVIAPDFIGFGRSDKYTSPDNYTHELHMRTVKLLLKHLRLETNVTLVCQDWGGLTGLSVVKDVPKVFSELVIMNTALPTAEGKKIDLRKAAGFLLWRNFTRLFGTLMPVGWVFRFAAGIPKNISRGYDAPFPAAAYRGGAAKWPLLVPLFPDDAVAPHMTEAAWFLRVGWRARPTLVMWGDCDPVMDEKFFLDLLPQARFHIARGAGHFLQETHGPELSRKIVQFLDDVTRE